MRAITILCAAIALSACDSVNGTGRYSQLSTSLVAPTPLLSARISPQRLPIFPTTAIGCPFAPAFTTAFDLFIIPSSTLDLILDRVTLRLVDGSSVGNPPLTYPKPGLQSIFGSTLVRAGINRIFAFQPQFGCGLFIPRSIAADVTLVDAAGNSQMLTVTAPFQ
jgi:hypothetical protein